MVKMKKVLLSIFFLGCSTAYQPDITVVVPKDTSECDDACIHLRSLSCEEGENLPDGTSCETFCEKTQKRGHALSPSCVLRIDSCDDMDNLMNFCPVEKSEGN